MSLATSGTNGTGDAGVIHLPGLQQVLGKLELGVLETHCVPLREIYPSDPVGNDCYFPPDPHLSLAVPSPERRKPAR